MAAKRRAGDRALGYMIEYPPSAGSGVHLAGSPQPDELALALVVTIRTCLRGTPPLRAPAGRAEQYRFLQPFEVGQVAQRLHAKGGEKCAKAARP